MNLIIHCSAMQTNIYIIWMFIYIYNIQCKASKWKNKKCKIKYSYTWNSDSNEWLHFIRKQLSFSDTVPARRMLQPDNWPQWADLHVSNSPLHIWLLSLTAGGHHTHCLSSVICSLSVQHICTAMILKNNLLTARVVSNLISGANRQHEEKMLVTHMSV